MFAMNIIAIKSITKFEFNENGVQLIFIEL